ncbi:MAG: hypothetical protein ACYS67_10625 [Planctomycetota bacterium]|jgi:hypothetical protein
MNTFIENNKSWLKFYCTTARIIGWGILIMAGAGTIFQILAMNILFGNYSPAYRFLFVKSVLFQGLLPGIFVLGIAQFIRYLFESEHKPGFLLRYGETILYLFAFLLMAVVVWQHLIISGNVMQSDIFLVMNIGLNFKAMLPSMLASLVLTVPKILILVGLAQVVNRILPVIEESKTLV